MTFARPLLLLLLVALPLWWWWRAKRLNRLAGATMSDVRPAAGPAERLWIARLPVSLRSLCLAAWIIAAAGPRLGLDQRGCDRSRRHERLGGRTLR